MSFKANKQLFSPLMKLLWLILMLCAVSSSSDMTSTESKVFTTLHNTTQGSKPRSISDFNAETRFRDFRFCYSFDSRVSLGFLNVIYIWDPWNRKKLFPKDFWCELIPNYLPSMHNKCHVKHLKFKNQIKRRRENGRRGDKRCESTWNLLWVNSKARKEAKKELISA